MKKIIILVVLIVIVLIIVSVSRKSDKIPVDTTVNIASSTDSVGVIKADGLTLADGSYTIAPSDASVNWTGRKVVLKNWVDRGTIAIKEATFEVKGGAVVSNKFVLDMSTIAAKSTGAGGGQDKLSTHLKSADFFDVATYPTSMFVIKSITATSSGSFLATGDLTIKGQTHEVSVPATFVTTTPGTIMVKGAVDVDRTKWDVRYGSGKFFKSLGDNVIDDMFNLAFDLKLKAGAMVPPVGASTATTTVR